MASSHTTQPDHAHPNSLDSDMPQPFHTTRSVSASYALLLTPPLDTPEKVQEVTDLPAPPPIITREDLPDDKGATSNSDSDDQAHSSSDKAAPTTIPPTGTFVLLPTAAAKEALLAWAARHRAIYTPTIRPVPAKAPDKASTAELTTPSDDQSKPRLFPCWYFFPTSLYDPATISRLLSSPEAEAEPPRLRPARLRGRKTKRQHQDRRGAASLLPATTTTTTTAAAAVPASTKLRPAQDILHRLRWDPSFSGSAPDPNNNPNPNPNPNTNTTNPEDEYTIIYHDRFAGEMSLPLSQWTRDTSADEFIPLHRIQRFERARDGAVLWDRGGRVDRVFGSGSGGVVVVGGADGGAVTVGGEGGGVGEGEGEEDGVGGSEEEEGEAGVAYRVLSAEEGERMMDGLMLLADDEMSTCEVCECRIEFLDGEEGVEGYAGAVRGEVVEGKTFRLRPWGRLVGRSGQG